MGVLVISKTARGHDIIVTAHHFMFLKCRTNRKELIHTPLGATTIKY
jgi:hypothetical protein